MPELESFVSRYLPHFGRAQNHAHAMTILQGLLAGGDRRNVENMAETIEGGVVRTLQKFIAQAVWSDQDVLAELRQHVCEALGEEDGLLIVDETGFPKKGKLSVGVARQYSGTLGRVDNCQVGVFVSYCSSQGETLIDRRLFLPEQWIIDEQRLAQAGVPSSVIFRSKPELASEMIQQAIIEGVPFQWVCGDSIYGTSPVFVQTVRELGKWYVVETSCDARVWTTKPKLRPVGHHHTCLSMLALLFLTLQKQRLGEKTSRADCSGGPQRTQTPAIYKRLDRGRTRSMEPMANGPQSDRKTLPRTKKKKRTSKTH
ncbi:hypothetical protein CA11_40410 [Gimesia maris]|nr:hypothetical protein CA11_40410 [Gimesia maris]